MNMQQFAALPKKHQIDPAGLPKVDIFTPSSGMGMILIAMQLSMMAYGSSGQI